MDDIGKHAPSYQLDQEILDARGINMTVEEVAGLPTCKYTERVQSLILSDDDLTFLKGLRRRIKNRLASQNSRRRSMEHLRRLTRELRAVRACREDALSERRALLESRTELRKSFTLLRNHVLQTLKHRSDPSEVPDIEQDATESHYKEDPVKNETKTLPTTQSLRENRIDIDKHIFECRIDKLVQQSVNHMYKREKRVYAKTIFLDGKKSGGVKADGTDGVLDLCVKEKRRSHGRKQLAPRRITYCDDYDDGALDLKIKN
ncbi:segmentation protein cap'n'collar-like [Vanessa cardui]|uniref:segmentation protein cap'n'collar-like n=1 Tax=Vanessa cardui TaxID=171605 RepID=UPI001F13FD0A|nr:segmentation protein cap'n'collar-like [Vanessa cardui]